MQSRAHNHAERDACAGEVLAKAAVRAADELGLSQADLARVLGTSAATVSRLRRAGELSPDSKEGELALLVIRAYRSLDALVGTDAAARRAWFSSANHHLGGVPAELVQRVEGLVRVVEYLDAMRGKV